MPKTTIVTRAQSNFGCAFVVQKFIKGRMNAMIKFYTTVGTLVRTKDGITISKKGKEYPLTKQEEVLWLILANDIIEDINVKREYESKIKQQNEYEEDTFERTLDSLVQKGLIIFGKGESLREALFEVGEKLKEDMLPPLTLKDSE